MEHGVEIKDVEDGRGERNGLYNWDNYCIILVYNVLF